MTDFEEYGYSQGPVAVPGRYWLMTVDFEAFNSGDIKAWLMAMRHWAARSARYGFRFSFFMSMEDVAGLKANSPAAYDDFMECIPLLHESGTRFYTHNHSVFDPETGVCMQNPDREPPERYTKRLSMFYRAHYLQRVNFPEWMNTVRAYYEQFLSEAGVPRPDVLAFRAGGWDYGSTPEDLAIYIEALSNAGYGIDSSGCSGVFGTPSWRMGADYQSNVFRLNSNLIEVAPNHALDCGQPLDGQSSPFERHSPGTGVYVHVLHFDHVFHGREAGKCAYFSVTDHAEIKERIDRFFRTMGYWWNSRPLKIATFDDLEFAGAEENSYDAESLPTLSS